MKRVTNVKKVTHDYKSHFTDKQVQDWFTNEFLR